MGSQGEIPLQEGLRVRDLRGDLKGVWGEVCDLIGGISCGNSTLKGITREGFHDLIGDLMRSGITIEEDTRRRITRERGEGRRRGRRTHEEEKEEGDHTREGGRRRKGGRAAASLGSLKFLRDTGGICFEKVSFFSVVSRVFSQFLLRVAVE